MLGVIAVFGSIGFALIIGLLAARRRNSVLEKAIRVSSRFSLVLIIEAIPVAVVGWMITWFSLSQEERAANCDVCPGDAWLYIGLGLFSLGGVLQLVPIGLGLCQGVIVVHKKRQKPAKHIPINSQSPKL